VNRNQKIVSPGIHRMSPMVAGELIFGRPKMRALVGRSIEALMLMDRIVGWDSIAAEMQGRKRLHSGRILRRSGMRFE
jgi:hypothetical protein